MDTKDRKVARRKEKVERMIREQRAEFDALHADLAGKVDTPYSGRRGIMILNNITAKLVAIAVILLVLPTTVSSAPLAIYTEVISVEGEDTTGSLRLPNVLGISDVILSKSVNLQLHYPVIKWAQEFVESARLDYQYYQQEDSAFSWRVYDFQSGYEVRLNNEEHFSITQFIYQYTGGAHGMSYLRSLNVNLLDGKIIPSLEQLEILPEYQDIILAAIQAQMVAEPHLYFDITVDYIHEESFYLTQDGVVVYYQLYEIAPYSSGIPQFLVPWEVLGKDV